MKIKSKKRHKTREPKVPLELITLSKDSLLKQELKLEVTKLEIVGNDINVLWKRGKIND